ncbi:MAG: hypothetical protein ACXVCY_09665, partial [Pseudobdellovibrionaceae bacterium]
MKSILLITLLILSISAQSRPASTISSAQNLPLSKQSPTLELRQEFSIKDSHSDFLKTDFLPPINQLIHSYAQGGDISGGGFGLIIKGTDHVILHDLWCENRKYQYIESPSLNITVLTDFIKSHGEDEHLILTDILPEETNLALTRTKIWASLAPGLMQEVQKILTSKNIWYATNIPPNDNVKDQFEFPGSAQQQLVFHQKYQEIQVAHVQKFPGRIYINAELFDRMDLKSRAGLLLHESLRFLYLKSIKGYLLPSILQWMTGAIMQRNPALKQDSLMIKAFYEELFVNMDNSDVKDRRRPKAWRNELCEKKAQLVDEMRASFLKSSVPSDLSAEETMESLCKTHDQAVQVLSQRSNIVILKSFDKLPKACGYNALSEIPTYTLVYWLQKRFDIGLAWSKHNQADVIMDLPYLLSQERNFLSKEAYEEVMRRFL